MNWIAKLSTIFEIGDIVRVPFPYVERDRSAARPALIVSVPVGPEANLLWSVMITSARHSAWPGDIPVGDAHLDFGLPVPCLIRTGKIATLNVAFMERRLGCVPAALLTAVQDRIIGNLSL